MPEASLTKRKFRPWDFAASALVYASAAVSVLIVGAIIVYIAANGMKTVNFKFLTSVTSIVEGTVGIAGNIVNTLYVIVITLAVSVPVSIGAAVYLNEYAQAKRLVRFIEFTIETLAGIPSIIFGLFGMVFFGQVCGFGYSILTGSLTLAIMVLPLLIRSTQEALSTAPKSWREGALGLGAEKWYMIRTILIPASLDGIVTGIILAAGRIIGESAALLFTAGSGYYLPRSLASKIFESGGTLTLQLYLSVSKGDFGPAMGIACVLLVLIVGINCAAKLVAKKVGASKSAN